MKMTDIAIIGGGASGMFLAGALDEGKKVTLFERCDRLGRKLSATGNGQGNITNLAANKTAYFSSERAAICRASEIIATYDQDSLMEYFRSLGVLLTADERGRVYPAGRQASALTDALRFFLAERGVDIRLSARVLDIEKTENGFLLTAEIGEEKREEQFLAEKVVLCAGGKAAKNFGTDGQAYALAHRYILP